MKDRGIQMLYNKINFDLIVVADEVDAVAVELNAALNRFEVKHTLFGSEIETLAFEHSGARKRSAPCTYNRRRRDGRRCYESCT